MDLTIIASAVAGVAAIAAGGVAISLRRVVPTNMVHIVQTTKSSTPYGRGKDAGNTYYAFPSWIPKFGIMVTEFPESIFQVSLNNYTAYDQGRMPFDVTAVAFFKINDAETAAQRVATFEALRDDLHVVLQGAVRSVLAKNVLEHIMSARSELSEQFTAAVEDQVKQWGVATVKAIEFMDIRDANGSDVIANIMAKEVSRISKDSRVAVANNAREAQLAEIEAQQQVEMQRQDAEKQVGMRRAAKDREVGIANETAKQEITSQERVTTERKMEVARVTEIKAAEIRSDVARINAEQEKGVAIVQAQQNRETATVNAEAQKAAQVTLAEGNLVAAQKEAEATRARGEAAAAAEQAMLMAPITTQIALAKEIGSNEGYQNYLIDSKKVDSAKEVGIEMAKAMQGADLKVIANAGDPQSGIAKLGDLFTPAGGTSLSGMLAALAATEEGKALVKRITGSVQPMQDFEVDSQQ